MEITGGYTHTDDNGNVTVGLPTLRAGALIAHKTRLPEVLDDGRPRCTRCRSGDVVVQIEWPGNDGSPLNICRECVLRPPGSPLIVKFQEG